MSKNFIEKWSYYMDPESEDEDELSENEKDLLDLLMKF